MVNQSNHRSPQEAPPILVFYGKPFNIFKSRFCFFIFGLLKSLGIKLTIFVMISGNRNVKARIQENVVLSEVIRQLLCSKTLSIDSSRTTDWVLRSREGELVTESNMYLLLEGGKE